MSMNINFFWLYKQLFLTLIFIYNESWNCGLWPKELEINAVTCGVINLPNGNTCRLLCFSFRSFNSYSDEWKSLMKYSFGGDKWFTALAWVNIHLGVITDLRRWTIIAPHTDNNEIIYNRKYRGFLLTHGRHYKLCAISVDFCWFQ